MKAILALEDGRTFEGDAFGVKGEKCGEVVFNTSITGYQEILTDPSYKGQIVTLTYPLIGNYGVNNEDYESLKPYVEGFVIRELSGIYSNWRAKSTLQELLERHNVIGLQGIDTRALTRHIRTVGAMKAIISTEDMNKGSLVAKAKASPGLVGEDMVKEVSCESSYHWQTYSQSPKYCVVVIDFGIKLNILRMLERVGCKVIIVPAKSTVTKILSYMPDGIFLSNGPGDPQGIPYAIETIKELLQSTIPIFGICLGHQILGLAFGGTTYKLKFGHRGGNQPVKNLETTKVEITAQNHGFAVNIDSITDKGIQLTHINLNDNTVEGMRHQTMPIFSVQYHPEASPGPHDSSYLFNQFAELMGKKY